MKSKEIYSESNDKTQKELTISVRHFTFNKQRNSHLNLKKGNTDFNVTHRMKIFDLNGNDKKYDITSKTLPSLQIESKNFFFKNCFRNPNLYYASRSVTKVKLEETNDTINSNNRYKPNDFKSTFADKWKMRVKDLNRTICNSESLFLTLNKEPENHMNDKPRKVGSINKLRKMHTMGNIKKDLIEEKKVKINIKDYNDKVLQNNNKKNMVLYNSLRNSLHLPSLVFNNFEKNKTPSKKACFIRINNGSKKRINNFQVDSL